MSTVIPTNEEISDAIQQNDVQGEISLEDLEVWEEFVNYEIKNKGLRPINVNKDTSDLLDYRPKALLQKEEEINLAFAKHYGIPNDLMSLTGAYFLLENRNGISQYERKLFVEEVKQGIDEYHIRHGNEDSLVQLDSIGRNLSFRSRLKEITMWEREELLSEAYRRTQTILEANSKEAAAFKEDFMAVRL